MRGILMSRSHLHVNMVFSLDEAIYISIFFVIVLTSDRVICSKIVHNLIVRLKNVNFFEYFKTRLEAIT